MGVLTLSSLFLRTTHCAMTDISFYHLTSSTLDDALPKLLEKALQGGFKVIVRAASDLEAERLCHLLWTYDPDSFLPHGTVKDGSIEQQPIYITAGEENPNGAKLLVITNGLQLNDANGFDRVLDIFNGADEEQLAAARLRWKNYTVQGTGLAYIQQNSAGGWEKQGA